VFVIGHSFSSALIEGRDSVQHKMSVTPQVPSATRAGDCRPSRVRKTHPRRHAHDCSLNTADPVRSEHAAPRSPRDRNGPCARLGMSGASSVQSWKSEASASSSHGSLHVMHRDAAHRSGPSQFNVGPGPDTASTSANVSKKWNHERRVRRRSGERGRWRRGAIDPRTARLLREKATRAGGRNGSHHRRSVAVAWGGRRRRSHGAVGNNPGDASPHVRCREQMACLSRIVQM